MQFKLAQLIATALFASFAMVQASPTSKDVEGIVVDEAEEAIFFPAADWETPAVNTNSARSIVVWPVGNVWVDAHMSGAHTPLKVQRLTQCYNFASQWNDVISSLEIDDAFLCTFYVHGNCQGTSIRISGSYDHLTPGIINDQLSSFECNWS